jgi:hypothetical protein
MARSQHHLRRVQGVDSSGNRSGVTRDPKMLTKPTVSGTATNTSTLTGVNGTFTDYEGGITRQWAWVDPSTGVETVIAGQTGATYVISGMSGRKIVFQNQATNRYGTRTVSSTPTATVP